jgi:SAM-dependent methyltransferase
MGTDQLLTPQEVGLTTLEHLSTADQLNQWMFETIRPYVKGKVLEIGSGIGNISECFVLQGMSITLSDLELHYCNLLCEKFSGEPKVQGVHQIDLGHPNFERAYSSLLGSFDTVFALNVVEHIQNDQVAVANAKKLLRNGGYLIVLVPAYKALYNELDEGLEHWRRYNRKTLKSLLTKDFDIVKTQYFNLAGIAGWFLSGSILHHKTLPAGSLKLYNKLVPLFRMADEIVFHRIGLSVIAIGKKK